MKFFQEFIGTALVIFAAMYGLGHNEFWLAVLGGFSYSLIYHVLKTFTPRLITKIVKKTVPGAGKEK